MDTNVSNSWWDNYRKTVTVTRRFRELVSLANNSEDAARNALDSLKKECPGKAEIWYLNKLISELKEGNMMGFAY